MHVPAPSAEEQIASIRAWCERYAAWLATAGTAQLIGEGDRLGQIMPGRHADLVAYAEDPLTCAIDRMRDLRPTFTIHDTRQPLTTIKGFHQLIARALDRPELDRGQLQDYLRRASGEVDRKADLLSTLSEVSRLALGRLALRVTSVDLADLVRAVVDRLSPDLGQRIRLDLPPEGDARGDWDAAMLDR
jgi:signal transduction histidine kinase